MYKMFNRVVTASALAIVCTYGAMLKATPPVTTDLQVWLNAESGVSSMTDGEPVLNWIDAHNGHRFSNANSLTPTYVADAGGGLPAIDLQRSSGFLGDFSSTAGSLLGDATVFVIGKFGGYTHSSSSSSYFFSIDSSTGQAEHALGRDQSSLGPDQLYHWRSQPSPPGFYGTNIVENANGDFNYFTAVYRGGDGSGLGMEAWINGSAGLAGPADLSTAGSDAPYGADPSKMRLGLWTSNSSGLDGQIRELLLYDRILTADEVQNVEEYLATRAVGEPPAGPEEFEFTVELSGKPNPFVPGFVPHGDPQATAQATLTIRDNNTMDYNIVLSDDRYRVTQAHLYNINKTSGTSGNPAHGDSIICWGGRWESNAVGGDSSDFLTGHGYTNGRLSEVLADPSEWFLMLHTEGGHFAVDETGGLIPYDPNPAGLQETSVTGVPESERAVRFNNRVGKTLRDLVLREDNANDPTAPFQDPSNPLNQSASPFPDANGNLWVEPDGLGGLQLTQEAINRGYDLSTEYLFFLYDDQGPSWDFGGPEGALGGFLKQPILLGDLDFDDDIDRDDWLSYLAGLGSDMTGLTDEESYLLGDLNGDQQNNHADFLAFKAAFESFNPGASIADLALTVPELSTAVLLIIGTFLASSRRVREIRP